MELLLEMMYCYDYVKRIFAYFNTTFLFKQAALQTAKKSSNTDCFGLLIHDSVEKLKVNKLKITLIKTITDFSA